MKISRYLILFLSILVLSGPAHSRDVLVLNAAATAPVNSPDQTGFVDRVVSEALRRVGYKLKTVHLPAERALYNANAGIDDGETIRIAGMQKIYPNLIQVSEKIMDMKFHAFSLGDEGYIKNWKDMSSNSVAYIRGWKIAEINVPKSSQSLAVKNPVQLFKLLKKRRSEIVIYERWGGLELMRQLEILDGKIIEPALAQKEMYMYLHKKHSDLVPLLASALRAMKSDGSYQKIYIETLGKYVE